MQITRTARRTRTTAALLSLSTMAALTGCAETAGVPQPTPAVSTGVSVTPAGPTTTAAAELAASFDKADFGPGVGMVLAPVGSSEVAVFGDQKARVAWSTMKVPVALAAQRNGAKQSLINRSIIDSDNDANLALRESLGTPEQASDKITAVLRDGGDTTTELVEIVEPDETFGLTVWPLTASAVFTAHLPCLPDAGQIVTDMGEVAGNQQWGLKSMTAKHITTAVKGGWGPAAEGGVEVRQIGLITWRDGRQLAVSMSSYQPGAEMGVGTANLNRMATWLGRNLKKLPRGAC
ncbi:hypothetical protein ACFQNE_07625 [Gordonia phosphorivorans]|uniref:Serine hydrolase n=2 Tax=Gordonia TaxID=2053 RepID=A0ABP8Z3W8_9ACTN